MQQFREVSRTRTIYSTETHTSDFILNTLGCFVDLVLIHEPNGMVFIFDNNNNNNT